MKRSILSALFVIVLGTLPAMASVVGRWQTIDDKTGEPKSIVEITEQDGKLSGKIVELINPSEPNPTCTECKGKRKGKPIKGMEILWGFKSSDKDSWKDGTILDPQNGKEYSCNLSLADNGKKLNVRGFIGFSLIGRTQTWIRQEAPESE